MCGIAGDKILRPLFPYFWSGVPERLPKNGVGDGEATPKKMSAGIEPGTQRVRSSAHNRLAIQHHYAFSSKTYLKHQIENWNADTTTKHTIEYLPQSPAITSDDDKYHFDLPTSSPLSSLIMIFICERTRGGVLYSHFLHGQHHPTSNPQTCTIDKQINSSLVPQQQL